MDSSSKGDAEGPGLGEDWRTRVKKETKSERVSSDRMD